jgi:hypothetical protein
VLLFLRGSARLRPETPDLTIRLVLQDRVLTATTRRMLSDTAIVGRRRDVLTLEQPRGKDLRWCSVGQEIGRGARGAVPGEPGGDGRSQTETWVGCMVWSMTANSSLRRVSRSNWSRRRVENPWTVWAALDLRRLKRRSTAAWIRRRAVRKIAAAASVAAETSQLGGSAPVPATSTNTNDPAA